MTVSQSVGQPGLVVAWIVTTSNWLRRFAWRKNLAYFYAPLFSLARASSKQARDQRIFAPGPLRDNRKSSSLLGGISSAARDRTRMRETADNTEIARFSSTLERERTQCRHRRR